MIPVITIDGASGVGKGTLAFRVAQYLGYQLLDSGAIYRALALYAISKQIDLEDEVAVNELAKVLPLRFEQRNDSIIIFIDGKDITQELRLETTGNKASVVAKHPSVRASLIQRQRNYATLPGLVADGRDMGTTIFPDAAFKFFLMASAEIRAKRRYQQLLDQGFSAKISDIIEEIKARDYRDQTRSTSPLIPAVDAVVIDTSDLNADQVFEKVCACLNNK